MSTDRMRRVDALIQQELADLIERDLRGYLPALTTITGVKTSPDLQQCDVFVSVFGDEDKQHKALTVLTGHRIEFQKQLSRRVKIKYTPILKFHLDTTLDKADKVWTIMNQLHLNEDLPEHEAEAGPEGGKPE
jgi:ribosome-binding factor A